MTTMQCCANNWNPGCCSPHHCNAVTFENLKTKYSMKEDIRVEYTLQGHMQQASTRDWIGIFPRGWTNLQQYLTFEYTLVAPRIASSPNRIILFPRVFHQEASTNIEYQFVYVSREIQVLAMSSYFRFIRDDAANRVLRVPYSGERISAGEKWDQICPDSSPAFGYALPRIVLSDQSLLLLRPSGTVPENPRLHRSCRNCGKPRDNGSCNFAANRTRLLATHNVSLAERIIRLERDLALAESVKCNLATRLRAYEGFVAEMLRSLAAKRTVKITDASGKEMVLQQILNVGVTGERNVNKENLQQGLDECPPEGNKDLPTNDRVFAGEYLSTDKLPSTEDDRRGDEQVQRQLPNDCADDLVHQTPLAINIATQTQPGHLSDDKPLPSLEDTSLCTDAIEETVVKTPGDSDECGEQRAKAADDVAGQRIEILDTSAAEVRKEAGACVGNGWTDFDNEKVNEEGKALQLKPSAIVIQGSNVKFAIIRY